MPDVHITVGRFNPFTKAHKALVDRMIQEANEDSAFPLVFIVDNEKSSKDRKRNPLSGQERREIIRKVYGSKVIVDIVDNLSEVPDILFVRNFRIKKWFAGSDRVLGYRTFLENVGIKGDVMEFDRLSGSLKDVSATKARECAVSDDYLGFKDNLPELPEDYLTGLMKVVKERHGV